MSSRGGGSSTYAVHSAHRQKCCGCVQTESNQRQLSKWLRPLAKVHSNYGQAAASLQRFFADHANFKVPPRAAKPAAAQPRDLAFFGTGRAGPGGTCGSRPALLGGPDLLLDSLANVPSAADASGLPGAAGCSAHLKPISLQQSLRMRYHLLVQTVFLSRGFGALLAYLLQGVAHQSDVIAMPYHAQICRKGMGAL